MTTPPDLTQLSPDQLRHLAATLMTQVEEKEKALRHSEQVNQKLTYEEIEAITVESPVGTCLAVQPKRNQW